MSYKLCACIITICGILHTACAAPRPLDADLQPAERRSGGLGTKADFGYVEVRPGANMFWTLEPCTECHHMSIFEEPLIIWLQGGPGASGAGYGNFMEIGPYGIGWKRRKHTWARAANLLFIDNPVGTGWSFVEEHGKFATDNDQVVDDLMTLFKEWSKDHFEFHTAPVYLFCESYGGKMGAAFAKAIAQAQRHETLRINFQGVALGDSWISPTDFVASWAPYLNALSLLDGEPLANATAIASNAQAALRKGNGEEATHLYEVLQEAIGNATDNVDWYNALLHNIPDDDAATLLAQRHLWGTTESSLRTARQLGRHHPESLVRFMNHEVRRELAPVVPSHVRWAMQSNKVFDHLRGDFMTDIISTVDELLTAGVPVTVYEGQLDLICCTLGAEAWMAKLQWPGMRGFNAAQRRPWYLPDAAAEGSDTSSSSSAASAGAEGGSGGSRNGGPSQHVERRQTAGFVREHGPLAKITVMGAGHMIPIDQPEAGLLMVEHIMRRHKQIVGGSLQDSAAHHAFDSA